MSSCTVVGLLQFGTVTMVSNCRLADDVCCGVQSIGVYGVCCWVGWLAGCGGSTFFNRSFGVSACVTTMCHPSCTTSSGKCSTSQRCVRARVRSCVRAYVRSCVRAFVRKFGWRMHYPTSRSRPVRLTTRRTTSRFVCLYGVGMLFD